MSNPPVRQLMFDTETTGLPPDDENLLNEHRVCDIAFVEMMDFQETGRVFHEKIDPQRDIPPDATAIHGITNEEVIGKPIFLEIVPKLLEFLKQTEAGQVVEVVAHNAPFDMRFLREELARANETVPAHLVVVDTLSLARKRYPRDASLTVDALVAKLGIDGSGRAQFHGALVDAMLLPPIYRHLKRQDELSLGHSGSARGVKAARTSPSDRQTWFPRRPARAPSDHDAKEHAAFIAEMPGSLWGELATAAE